MYNEVANLAHRMGVHYDTGGAFGNPFHLALSLTWGDEGACVCVCVSWSIRV